MKITAKDGRWKMEAKEKMPGFRRWVLGDRRSVSDKCFLNSTLCTPCYPHEIFLKDLSFQAAKDISASIRWFLSSPVSKPTIYFG
jgi:hypothetical protein